MREKGERYWRGEGGLKMKRGGGGREKGERMSEREDDLTAVDPWTHGVTRVSAMRHVSQTQIRFRHVTMCHVISRHVTW